MLSGTFLIEFEGAVTLSSFLQEHKSLILGNRGRDKRWQHNGWIKSGRKSLNQCERLVWLSTLIPHTFIPSITEPLMDLDC